MADNSQLAAIKYTADLWLNKGVWKQSVRSTEPPSYPEG